MLRELVLRNFRGFSDHTLPLRALTVIVGRNNAGKSTIAEGLRLVSVVASRFKSLGFHNVPKWLDAPIRERGVRPSLRNLEINFSSLFNQYRDPPAVVEARFDNGAVVKVYLGEEERIHGVITNELGGIVRCRGDAQSAQVPSVAIMPQVGPLLADERILTKPYVRSAVSSSLASLHFRNQLRAFDHLFDQFRKLSEETWPGLQVMELQNADGVPGEELSLLVRDREFVGQVGAMGHGLQMWMQTMLFLVRAADMDTVILDEPDVYLHADLQRKLIRLLRGRFRQFIVTTHSSEMMAEAEPEDILVVDRRRERSQFASTLPSLQRVLQNIGSSQNIHLARLWHSRRFIMVEGKDLKVLKTLQNLLYPGSGEPIDALPNMSIGGWDGWNFAVGSRMTLKNALGDDITTYCILDSDYHCEEELEQRREAASRASIELHIWQRKEIENYLLIPDVIQRLITSRLDPLRARPTAEQIGRKIRDLAEELEEEALDDMSAVFLARDRKRGIQNANRKARQAMRRRRSELGGLLWIVSGKKVISRLSGHCQRAYGASISVASILTVMTASDVPTEMGEVVSAIESTRPFSTS